jgi:hypothetical protein
VKAVALLMKTSFFTIALEEGAVLFLTRFGKHHSYFFFFMQAKALLLLLLLICLSILRVD